ncbi:uncharacterized protein LOC125590553 [Brassica napus]|nr:uncharacterized protein LOC125590553 [Brassica napus]
MAAKPLLKSGLRKSIGSGYNTRVWDELWLTTNPPRSPSGVRPIQKPNMLVHELIDRHSKSWNVELLKNFTAPEDISLITSIRIIKSFKVDSFCCVHTKSGIYSVKAGYDEKCRLDNEQPAEACTEPSTTSLTQQTWALAHLPLHPGEFPCSSIYINFDCILNRIHIRNGTEESLARTPWVIWFLWKACNAKVFDNKDISSMEVIQSATSEAESWRLAQITPEVTEENGNIPTPELLYRPPQRPFCRFDASWKGDDARYGDRLVIENEDETTTFGSLASNRTLSPLHAEFGTLLWAMKSSLTLGHESMAFESDCLQLVRLIE